MAIFESELIADDPKVKALAANFGDGSATDRWYKDGKCLLPNRFQRFEERIYNFDVRPDDIWVITFPKCGTTWAEEMVWLISHGFNFEEAERTMLDDRSIFLELGPILERYPFDSIAQAEQLKSPRNIKSHLPVPMLPKQIFTVKPKIVYVYRNPKDVVISFFHHHRLINSYSGSLEEFIDAFLDDKTLYGSFWDNVLPYWKLRHEPNLLFITYEEMKKDLYSVAKRTADFLGVELKEDLREKFLKHLSFEEMKKNPSVNKDSLIQALTPNSDKKFIREGKSGEWAKVLDEETVRRFDEKAKKALEGTDFLYY